MRQALGDKGQYESTDERQKHDEMYIRFARVRGII